MRHADNVFSFSIKIISIIFLLIHGATCLDAQSATAQATLRGTVLDPSGAAVAEAEIKVFDESRREVASTASDRKGVFTLDLPSGRLRIRVRSTGFVEWIQELDRTALGAQEIRLTISPQQGSLTVTEVPERLAASKLTIPLRETPVTVGVITSETIRAQGHQELTSAVRYLSNVHSRTNFGTYEHYTIRGFGDVIQMMDGIRQEDRRFNTQIVNVEQVEILKGPASALYGNSAVGGVLNVIRKKPTYDPLTELTLTGGKWGNRRGALATGGRLGSDKLLHRFDFGFADQEGYRRAPTRQYLVAPVLLWRPTTRDQLNIHYQYNNDRFATDSGLPTLGAAIPEVDYRRRYNPPGDRALTRDHFTQVYYNRPLGERVDIRNVFSFRNFKDDYLSAETIGWVRPSQLNRTFFFFDRERTTTLNQVELTARLNTGAMGHTLLAGYEYQRFAQSDANGQLTGAAAAPIDLFNPIETEPAGRPNAITRIRQIRQNVNAIYVQDQIRLGKRVSIMAGLRYDPWRRRFQTDTRNLTTGDLSPGALTRLSQNATTGRIGFVYYATSFSTFYGSFGRAFTPVLSVPVNGSILDPERGRQWELGNRLDFFGRRHSLNLSAYHLVKNNVTIARGGGVFDQAGEQRSQGVEVDAEGQFGRRWRYKASYGLADAKYIRFLSGAANLAGRVPPFVPRHTASVWTTYEVGRGWSLAAGSRLHTRSFPSFFNTFSLGGYTVYDGAVMYHARRFDYSANLMNLGNKVRYFTGSVYNTQVYPGDAFNAQMTLRIRLR